MILKVLPNALGVVGYGQIPVFLAEWEPGMGWDGIHESGLWVGLSLTKHRGTHGIPSRQAWEKGEEVFSQAGISGNVVFPFSIYRTQRSCSKGFHKPGFHLQTYSQWDLGIDLPLFPHPRNPGGWTR